MKEKHVHEYITHTKDYLDVNNCINTAVTVITCTETTGVFTVTAAV